MFHWIALIWATISKITPPKDWDEAYLNKAVNVYDLERRMNYLDRQRNHHIVDHLRYGTERF